MIKKTGLDKMSETVEWRKIPRYDMYLISSDGQVWNKKFNWLLKPTKTKLIPYLYLNLSKGNKGYREYIHVLVAEAFIGPRPEGLNVCHNDSNPLNNDFRNLRYDTQSNNLVDAKAVGNLGKRGGKLGLTEEIVHSALDLFYSGGSLSDVALLINLNYQSAINLCYGKTYKKFYQTYKNHLTKL